MSFQVHGFPLGELAEALMDRDRKIASLRAEIALLQKENSAMAMELLTLYAQADGEYRP